MTDPAPRHRQPIETPWFVRVGDGDVRGRGRLTADGDRLSVAWSEPRFRRERRETIDGLVGTEVTVAAVTIRGPARVVHERVVVDDVRYSTEETDRAGTVSIAGSIAGD